MSNWVVNELIRAVHANEDLKHFDLGDFNKYLYWDPHLKSLVEVLEDRPNVCSFKASVCRAAFRPAYFYLQQLLSRNRSIRVANEKGGICSDVLVIYQLYS